jgi:ectoine hydroxylase-related dioxygenase (phytanoyl-CoA dioxygenase family)
MTVGEIPALTSLEVDGLIVERAVVDKALCTALLARAWCLVRDADAVADGNVVVRYERGFPEPLPPVERISKLYRLHRSEEALRALFRTDALAEVLNAVIGPDVDLFLSQIVFKLPRSIGQPWHQDVSIFPFEPEGPIVGVWCALTDARAPSSRLAVQRQSHRSGTLAHGRDPSHPTGARYVALLDQAVSGELLLELAVGDRVLFDAALVHASTDNQSNDTRVAATAHFAAAGTLDHSLEVFGANPFNDWLPWLRDGEHVE